MSTKESRPGARIFRALDSWRLDIKLGFRMLIKYPGLALVGGVGIAVAVAIAAGGYSVIYGTFLVSSLPLEEGDRIVSIEIWDPAASEPERRILRDYHIWREELKSVQQISAFRTVTLNLLARGAQPMSVRVAAMSASGFRVARVGPLMGRYLTGDDEREGAPAVVVIGENVWRNRFASDPEILGRTVQLGASPHTIVGVMPEDFAFPVNHRFWVPLRAGSATPEPLTGPDLMVFGRLVPGATFESAQAELAAIGQRAALEFPKAYGQLLPKALPYPYPFVSLHQEHDISDLTMTHGLVTLPLVLVCLNVAILVYTRTAMRQAEISVRTALGAVRGRIVAQLFIEALVLSAVGALVGVAIATFALRQVAAATLHIASDLPFWVSFQLSTEAVLYAGLLSVFAAAIVGIVPALKATRRGVQAASRIIGADGSGMRLGGTWTLLVVAQVGFAVALLPATLFNTWRNLGAELADPGFASEAFLTAQLGIDDLQGAGAVPPGAPEFSRRFADRQDELIRRLKAEPGLDSTTFSTALPGDEPLALIEIQGASSIPAPEAPQTSTTKSSTPQPGPQSGGSVGRSGETSGIEVRFNRVDVNFFRVFDVPILAGRDFEPADIAPARTGAAEQSEPGAVVVDQSFAQRFFGGNALGRRIRYLERSATAARNVEPGRWFQIVGIVRDFPTGVSPNMHDSPAKIYHVVAPGEVHPVNLALRVRGSPDPAFARSLPQAAAAVDPGLYLRNIVSMNEALRKEQWLRRLEAGVLGAISLSVLLLSSAGIYALMSFTVSQRRREIGIRMALGADRKRIVASIFSRAMGQLAVGAVVGIASGAALEQASGENLLRGNAAVVLPVVAMIMMAVGFLAALGPARRGLRIEPIEALREQ